MKTLLTTQGVSKLDKGKKYGYATAVLYLAPYTRAGGYNTCQYASPGCMRGCLYTAGRGVFNNVQIARVARTRLLQQNPVAFFHILQQDIARFVRKCNRAGIRPAIRLNGTSDIPFYEIAVRQDLHERTIYDLFPQVQFYDYTKRRDIHKVRLPKNLHITFSRSEKTDHVARKMLSRGISVSVVFRNRIPEKWYGVTTVDGDLSDCTYLYPPGSVIALRAKGKAKTDTTGFVVDVPAGVKSYK